MIDDLRRLWKPTLKKKTIDVSGIEDYVQDRVRQFILPRILFPRIERFTGYVRYVWNAPPGPDGVPDMFWRHNGHVGPLTLSLLFGFLCDGELVDDGFYASVIAFLPKEQHDGDDVQLAREISAAANVNQKIADRKCLSGIGHDIFGSAICKSVLGF